MFNTLKRFISAVVHRIVCVPLIGVDEYVVINDVSIFESGVAIAVEAVIARDVAVYRSFVIMANVIVAGLYGYFLRFGNIVVAELPGLILIRRAGLCVFYPIGAIADLEGAGRIGHRAGVDVRVGTVVMIPIAVGVRNFISIFCVRYVAIDPGFAPTVFKLAETISDIYVHILTAGAAINYRFSAANATVLRKVYALFYNSCVVRRVMRTIRRHAAVLAGVDNTYAAFAVFFAVKNVVGHNVIVAFLDVFVVPFADEVFADSDCQGVINSLLAVFDVFDCIIASRVTQIAIIAGSCLNVNLVAVFVDVLIARVSIGAKI